MRQRVNIAERAAALIVPAVLCVLPWFSSGAGGAQDTITGTAGQGAGVLRFVRLPSLRPAFSLLRSAGFRNWQGDLRFGYEWDRQDTSTALTPRERFERMAFAERVHLANSGFIFDPRLLSFRVGALVGLFQEQFTRSTGDSSSHGDLLGFDANAVLLGRKPYTLNVFGSRTEDVSSREFAGTTKRLFETYGSSLVLRSIPLYSTLSVRRERSKQQTFNVSVLQREEIRSIAAYQGSRLGEVSDLNVGYEFEDVDDQIIPRLSFRTHDADFSFRYYFGPYLEKESLSRVRLFTREGRVERVLLRAAETFRVDHTETFATLYDYTFLFNKPGDGQILSHLGAVGAQHQLFGSLTSNVRGLGNYLDFPNGRSYGYGGSLSVSYDKRMPLGGRLSAGGNSLYRIDNEKLAGDLVVIQERHAIEDFQPVTLDNARILRDTLFVTDESGTVAYQENFDYTVQQVGELTVLEILPGGNIEDGDVILVDYRYASGRTLGYSTLGSGVRLRLDYDWLALFFNHQRSDTTLLEGEGGGFLIDFTDQTVGGELRWTGGRAQAHALGEYRTYESTNVASTAPRLVQSFSVRPIRSASFTLTLSEAFSDYSKPVDRRTTRLLGRLSSTWRPLRSLQATGFASHLRLNDTVAPDQRFFDAGVRVEWQLGQLRIAPTVAFTRREMSRTESTGIRVTLWVTRRLF